MIHSSERSTKEYREFLIKLGACPECMSIPEHHIDEPFATCGCCTSENYAKSPLMQAQLMRAALKEIALQINLRQDISEWYSEIVDTIAKAYGETP